VTWADCVALLSSPDRRTLIGRDGSSFSIEASEWRDGRGATRDIDRLAPKDRVVVVEP
jgi:hypothetical protein